MGDGKQQWAMWAHRSNQYDCATTWGLYVSYTFSLYQNFRSLYFYIKIPKQKNFNLNSYSTLLPVKYTKTRGVQRKNIIKQKCKVVVPSDAAGSYPSEIFTFRNQSSTPIGARGPSSSNLQWDGNVRLSLSLFSSFSRRRYSSIHECKRIRQVTPGSIMGRIYFMGSVRWGLLRYVTLA